jgi:hypothetical protein
MNAEATTHPWRTSPAWSAAFRAVGLSIVGFIGWLWFSSEDSSAVSLIPVLALAALGGVAWYLPRASTERRWRAALDRYAEQQQAQRLSQAG